MNLSMVTCLMWWSGTTA
uniref:Uncharacterized protein n=1 Tax=Arundo donax TaxID=35708 RepID=A0A0A8ZMV4_ARUDO